MNDFRPIALTQTGHPVLGHARMTNTVNFHQLPVDIRILGMNVKNAGRQICGCS